MSKFSELESKLAREECKKVERSLSDKRYAWKKDFKLVEKIVFTFVGLVMLAFAGALITLIIK